MAEFICFCTIFSRMQEGESVGAHMFLVKDKPLNSSEDALRGNSALQWKSSVAHVLACLFVCFADGVLDMSPTDNFGIHPRHHLRPMCSYVSSGTNWAWWWVGLMSWTQTESSSPALVCSILTSKPLKGLM